MAIDLTLSSETLLSLTDNQLDSNFSTIQTAVNNLQSDAALITADLATAAGDIATLQGDVADITEAFGTLTPLTPPTYYTQLVLRLQKGSALTNEELDRNFIHLDVRANGLASQIDTLNNETIPAITSGNAIAFAAKQNLNAKLTSLSTLSTSGFAVVSGTSVLTRTITAASPYIEIANGDGVAGDPTITIGPDVVLNTSTHTLTNKTISGASNVITNVSLTSGVTGTLPVEKGGTNAITPAGARDSLQALVRPTGTGVVVKTGADDTVTRQIAVSGVGLSITNNDGVLGNPTITFSGTSAGTPSTPVVRDASGNFTANTITATLAGNTLGNAATVTNGVYTSGSYSNPSWITALAGSKVTSIPNSSLVNSSITINGSVVSLGGSVSLDVGGVATNTPNTYVKRDGSGNFAANTITATLVGNAASATSATTAITAQRLVTPRNINGVAFDGTQNITVVDNTKLLLNGGTLTGPLTLNADPTNLLHAATKSYVDAQIAAISPVDPIRQAWVKFSGTTGAIVKSRNVTSVTRTSTGTYAINITPGTFEDADMIVVGTASDDDHVVTYASSTAIRVIVRTHDSGIGGNNSLQDTSGTVHVMMVS